MSEASEKKRMKDVIVTYHMLLPRECAEFLRCSERHIISLIDRGILPGVRVGRLWRVDPIDLAVHVLAEREGITREEYWDKYDEDTSLHTRRLVRDWRRQDVA
jgi:excisionase family DNA binding protein